MLLCALPPSVADPRWLLPCNFLCVALPCSRAGTAAPQWYVGEPVQKEGVAIETRAFTVVTHGARRETLRGEATARFFPHLAETIRRVRGLKESICAEVCPSKARSFPLVELIDTPGLVDGDMEYGFDVKEAILGFAEHCDMVMCLFDPIGQALCKRTMDVVEQLNARHHEKMRFFVSKADQMEKESDRQGVLIQITQNLSSRLAASDNFALKLPTIYRPFPEDDPRAATASKIPNGIHEWVQDIDRLITQAVQSALARLKDDSEAVTSAVEAKLAEAKGLNAHNSNVRRYGLSLYLLSHALLVGLLLLLCAELLRLPAAVALLEAHAPPEARAVLQRAAEYASAAASAVDVIGEGGAQLANEGDAFGPAALRRLGLAAMAWLAMVILTKAVWVERPALTRAEASRLARYQTFCAGLEERREGMYDQLFRSLEGEGDGDDSDGETLDTGN